MNDTISIADAVMEMLAIVQRLRKAFPKKKFTLDGRLVGDIGEILAEEAYNLSLFADLQKHHDAETPDGRLVQIKATMQNSLTFPADHVPNYYLGIQVHSDGSFSEIFNGPGAVAREAVKNRKPSKTNLHSVQIGTLLALNKKVGSTDRISLRSNSSLQPTPLKQRD
jgi:hypothetical protein